MRLDQLLAPGATRSRPGAVRSGLGNDALDLASDFTSFIVHGTNATGAQADLPYELEIEPWR